MDISIADNAALLALFSAGIPAGSTVLLAPGDYPGYHGLAGAAGTEAEPITIAAADNANPPRFLGEPNKVSLKFTSCSWITVSHVKIENAGVIGVHFETPGIAPYDQSPSHHVAVEDCTILNTGGGDVGNHDAIKFHCTDHFAVRRCYIEGWGAGGGSAIDINTGSSHGVVDSNTFKWPTQTPPQTTTGVTPKGGARFIKITRNTFVNAGVEPVQIGQDSGTNPALFARATLGQPLSDGVIFNFEASDVEVAGNVIVGGNFPILFMKSNGGNVHHNTIVLLQPTVDSRAIVKITGADVPAIGIVKAHDGLIANNLIVYKWSSLETWGYPFVRLSGTVPAASTFTFDGNAWFQTDGPGNHLPNFIGAKGLPVVEANPVYQVDPQLSGIDASGMPTGGPIRITSTDPALANVGADHYVEDDGMTLLTGCSDPDGDALTAELVTQATNGVAVVNPDGTGSYTPNAGFAGVDTFAYRVSDGTAFSSPAVVTINVTNSPPTAADHAYSTPKNTPVQL